MRLSKMMLITLVLCSVSVLSLSCASDSASKLEGQVVTVQRGDLVIDITAAGNLALSHKEDLAFEMDGTVEQVLVAEAESVEEGQLLAKLDISAWEDHIAALEDKVIAAERNVTAKERAVTTKKRDLLQAQINLNNAELALEKTEEESTDRLEIEIKELGVELTKGRLEDAQIAVEDAEIAVEDAQKALEDAKQDLDEAMDDSPEITAPFAGFITKVNVKGGDEVKKGTVAVQLADPNKFEADILVNEMDFLYVKLGGEAWVQVDAMPGLSLPAKVAHISPTAIIQSGVVNYKVKVEVQSLEETVREQQEAMQKATQERQQASDNLSSDNISSGAQQRQRQQAQAGQPGGQQRQMPTMIPEDFKLTEGMTITLSIITQERNDVLLIPIQAIISDGRETLVQVLKNGVIEERSITVGISNWQYAEVTDGLSEGEQVVIPQGTATTPTTPQQKQPGGIMPIPGTPRMR